MLSFLAILASCKLQEATKNIDVFVYLDGSMEVRFNDLKKEVLLKDLASLKRSINIHSSTNVHCNLLFSKGFKPEGNEFKILVEALKNTINKHNLKVVKVMILTGGLNTINIEL